MRRSIVEVDYTGRTFDQACREFEAQIIEAAMRASNYRMGKAAMRLGISIERLRRRLQAGPPPAPREAAQR